MTNTAAIATKLNVLQSAIVRVEEWAHVLFVVVKGLGGRFVSKKVAIKKAATKVDKANHIASVFQSNGYKVKVWVAGDKVRVYVGVTGIYIDVTNNGRQLVGKNSTNEYNILREINLDAAIAGTQLADTQLPVWERLGFASELDYDMEHPNGRYYG